MMKVRNRFVYAIVMIITLVIGLASRKFPTYFGTFLATYLGDTLWAMLVYWLMAFVFPKLSSKNLFLMALIFAYGIEISQLYQAPWINQIRSTTLGSLVLGHSFLWSDFLCYTVGIFVAYCLEIFTKRFRFSLSV